MTQTLLLSDLWPISAYPGELLQSLPGRVRRPWVLKAMSADPGIGHRNLVTLEIWLLPGMLVKSQNVGQNSSHSNGAFGCYR